MIRTYSSRSHKRRSGQALLLAVLVMVFAALIGVTFITVVAINVGQTGRDEERDKARQAAQAGLAFANLQLTNSVWATRWNPADPAVGGNVPPTTTADPTYYAYWTPFDQAQGWNNAGFVKIPDPRSINPSDNAPNYMLKVEKVLETDADNTSKDKTGALRITAIGLSPDDPTSFYKVVAYKAGPAQSPLTGAMRSVSNWDFQDESVPTAQTANSGSTSTTATTTMVLASPQGSFAGRSNFYITISDSAGTNIRYAVVREANATGNILTLAPTATPSVPSEMPAAPAITWAVNERVESAAALGAQSALDFDNSGVANITNERVDFRVSTAPSTPGSIRVNGGLVLLGNAFMDNLLAPRQSSTTNPPGQIKASGLITVNSSSAPLLSGILDDGTAGGVATGTQTLLSSSDGNFPFAGAGLPEQKATIVEDGANRISGSPEPTRQVKSFTPPDITKGGNGFGRYRELTKYSAPANSGDPLQAAAYGYGQGIYINNPEDTEKIGAPVSSVVREMTQSELERLLFDHSIPGGTDESLAYLRSGTPLLANVNNVSLEQQHLRGWIAPDEFLPRGALVEINSNATLTITLDSISDGVGDNIDPVAAKSWRDENGDLINGTQGGVYRRENIPWPANGVLFAEGNIRLRGKATTVSPALPSLTVVSMKNIYIEGSIGVTGKKLVLLARKNVIVNPTRIVGRPFAQTRAGVGSTNTDIVVRDSALFNVGDRVQVGNGASYRYITAKSGNTLTLNAALGATPIDGTTVVRLQQDPINSTGTRPFFGNQTPYIKTETNTESQAFQRRFWLEGAPGAVRLAMRHGAQEIPALTLETTGAAPSNLQLGNKLSPAPNTPPAPLIVNSTEKNITIENDGNSPYPSDPATDTLNDLVNDLNGSYNTITDGWQYSAVLPVPPGPEPNYGSVPFRYLAGIGLRYKNDPTTPTIAPTAYASRQAITATAQRLYLATSIGLSVNNAEALLQLEDGAGGFVGINRFGFNFDFNLPEDALTVDRSFYSVFTDTDAGTNPLFADITTDSRRIANGLIGDGFNNIAWRFPDDVMPAFNLTRPLPNYALRRVKLENLNQYNGANFETLEPGYTLEINAYVYAQEGSWLVIPGVYFDERVKTTSTGVSFIDLNNNGFIEAGEYIDGNGNSAPDVNEALDFNRDGVISREEQTGVHRFLRYNYKVRFTGAIMENKSALIEDPDGTGPIRGFVADWTDKWANVRTTATNFPTTNFDPSTMSVVNNNYSTIEYNFDPSAARQEFINDTGFLPPISPDLIYQTG